jgi:hypothetical protein
MPGDRPFSSAVACLPRETVSSGLPCEDILDRWPSSSLYPRPLEDTPILSELPVSQGQRANHGGLKAHEAKNC